MQESRRILVCDHRGAGLEPRLAPLGEAGLVLAWSRSLRRSLERLGRERPDLLVLDPAGEGGRELELLLGAARGESQDLAGPAPALLLVMDPENPLPLILAARAHDGPVDLVHRDSCVEEYLLRIDSLVHQGKHRDEVEELRYRAVHDERTELLRPAAFQTRLQEHFSATERHHFPLAFVMIDLDDFGLINKRFDHTVGDHVIASAGAAIRSCLRAEDVAGRLGGDEFGVLLPYTSRLDAARVVRRIQEAIRAVSGRFAGAETEIQVSGSIGFETFKGLELADPQQLRRHAELALRHAKRSGGNRAVYYASLPE